MKIRIAMNFGSDFVVSNSKVKDLAEVIEMIDSNYGWFISSNVALQEKDILFIELEPETIEEFLEKQIQINLIKGDDEL